MTTLRILHTSAQGAVVLPSDFAPRIHKNRVIPLVIFLVLLFGGVQAQSYSSLDVAQHDFKIIAPSGTLQAGETATFFIELGTSASPVSDAVAFDIELEIGAGAEFPAPGKMNINDSWVVNPTHANTQEIRKPAQRKLRLHAVRTDGNSQSGYGELFHIQLKAQVSGISADKLISSGGGLIIVEDIGYKQTPNAASAGNTSTLYPNPCSSKLRMDWHGEVPESVQLVSNSGQLYSIPTQAVGEREWNTENLPSGLYKAVIRYGSADRETKTLVIQH